MKEDDRKPEFNKTSFTCPHCGVYAQQAWEAASRPRAVPLYGGSEAEPPSYESANFQSCNDHSFWNANSGELIYPEIKNMFPLHPDLPETCISEYKEAGDVFSKSPRAAAAMLRLCLQKLMIELGESGDISKAIASLIAKGLPVEIKQALDVCRVTGNHAIHPGQIAPDDIAPTAEKLFKLVNFIVERMITHPREIADLHDGLPEGDKKQIEKRDARALKPTQ